MKSILVATDLSARSDRAFERALILARQHQAKLHVVHIVDEALPDTIALHQREAAVENIHNQIAALPADGAPAVTAEVKIGKTNVDILRQAKDKQAELIVLGVHDIAYESFFRGTTFEQIIRMGDLPVLVVKDRPKTQYQCVAVALDFSVHSRRAVEFALGLAAEAEIHLVHAYHVPFAGFVYGTDRRDQVKKQEQQRMEQMIEREMSASLRAVGADAGKVHQVVGHGEAVHVIRQEVERIKPDLLALGTHGRTGVAHAFLGSVAEDVLSSPPCDALTVKAW